MDEQHNNLVAYVLDYPEAAAREIKRLRSEMNKTELAQAINASMANRWHKLEGDQRAQAVIDWCQENQIDTASIMARPLREAMKQQPYWCQGPDNYVDMIRSIAAFLAARI